MAASTVERELLAVLSTWQADHPKATLSELEAALDQHLDALRASVLSTAANGCETVTSCPACGQPLTQRGTHSRTLLTRGGEGLTLERSYLTCPACGDGLFPPG